MNGPTDEQRELLVKFIEKHVVFFDTYSNLLFFVIGLAVVFSIYLLFTRIKFWLIRIPALLMLLFLLTINVLFAILINYPLKPFVKSMATIKRAINSLPPDFEFRNVRSGENLNLTDFKGKVVLVNFWGTYCGPCVEEMPDLKKIEDELGEDLIVVSLSDESEDKIVRFLEKNQAPGIVGYFTKGDWIALGTFRPLTIYIDKTGKVVEYFFGKSDYQSFKRIALKYL